MHGELLVSRFGGELWVAVREDGRTVELRIDRGGDLRSGVGRIVLGRVAKVLPGMQAAFVDIGQDRDAFLHVDDLVLPDEEAAGAARVVDLDSGDEDDGDGDGAVDAGSRTVRRHAPIQDRLSEGREIVVQVTRDPMKSKGARVTCYLTLAGRWLVYMPRVAFRGVSRKITDPEERERLRDAVGALDGPGGFIARTAAERVEADAVRDDAERLRARWTRIEEKIANAAAPCEVHGAPDLVARSVLDAPRNGYDAILVDAGALYDHTRLILEDLDPAMTPRLRAQDGPQALFEAEGIDQDVDRALKTRVWLKSGGYLVIEPTEALVSIDVNTGKFVGKERPEETVLRTNLEAAREIARQLRLRDLGGIIVIDFIDMAKADARRRVTEALETALRRDRARTKVVGLSELGLMQLTRKRTRPGPAALLTRPCSTCAGVGRVKGADTVAWEAVREIGRLTAEIEAREVTVRAHPDVVTVFGRAWSEAAGSGLGDGIQVTTEPDPSVSPEAFDLVVR